MTQKAIGFSQHAHSQVKKLPARMMQKSIHVPEFTGLTF